MIHHNRRFIDLSLAGKGDAWTLGASDVAKLARGQMRELYLHHMGMTEPEDLTWKWPVMRGIALENPCLDWLENNLASPNRSFQRQPMLRSNSLKLHATFDMVVSEPGVPTVAYEVKASAIPGIENIARYYHGQLAAQSIVLREHERNSEIVLVSCLVSDEPELWRYHPDEEYERHIADLVERFYWHLINRIEPPDLEAKEPPPPKEAWKPYDFTGNNAWSVAAADWLQNRTAAAQFKAAGDTLKSLMPDDASKGTGHGVVVTRSKNRALTIKAAE